MDVKEDTIRFNQVNSSITIKQNPFIALTGVSKWNEGMCVSICLHACIRGNT